MIKRTLCFYKDGINALSQLLIFYEKDAGTLNRIPAFFILYLQSSHVFIQGASILGLNA